MVTVVAWNLNHWPRAHSAADVAATWTYLRDELGADVALVSEAAPPVGWEPVAVIGDLGDGSAGSWGAAIVNLTGAVELTEVTEVPAPDRMSTLPFRWTRPGTAAAATFDHPDGPVTLACVYGKFVGGRSYATMLHHAADLAPLLETQPRVLVAGDMNLTTQWVGADASSTPSSRPPRTPSPAGVCATSSPRPGYRPPTTADASRNRAGTCRPTGTPDPPGRGRSTTPSRARPFARLSVRVDAGAVLEHQLSDHAPVVIQLD